MILTDINRYITNSCRAPRARPSIDAYYDASTCNTIVTSYSITTHSHNEHYARQGGKGSETRHMQLSDWRYLLQYELTTHVTTPVLV